MKKLFVAFSILFFAGFSHAVTLEGKIFDGIKNEDISEKKIKVVLDNANPANSTTSKKNGFKLTNFNPTITQTITFTKEGYDEQTGEIFMKNNELFFSGGTYTDESFGTFTISKKAIYQEAQGMNPFLEENPSELEIIDYEIIYSPDTFTLPAIKLIPTAKEIISGTIYYENDEGDAIPLDFDKTNDPEISGDGKFAGFAKIETSANGEFKVMGYFDKTAEKDVNYEITINYPKYKEKTENIVVIKEEAKNNVEIVLREPSISSSREKNLEAITGFDCSDLMPKYLVGANCVENSTLDGDATDLAVWIQKFGGKITSMISMIAVVLIVWNAFNIVTASLRNHKYILSKKIQI